MQSSLSRGRVAPAGAGASVFDDGVIAPSKLPEASKRRRAWRALWQGVLLAGCLAASAPAQAWFFFFIPGPLIRGIGDAMTGAKGNICVKEGTQANDTLTSPTGNTAKVLSVSGTSSICPNPAMPIRAELQFNITYSSKAGIELPDDFAPRALTDLERFNGMLLIAESKSRSNHAIGVSSVGRRPNMDLQTSANAIVANALQSARFKEARSQNPEQLTINGTNAVRWEIAATMTGLFGPDVIFFNTLLEGDDEYLLVNVAVPARSFAESKPELIKIAESVKGIRAAPGEAPGVPQALPTPASPAAVSNEASTAAGPQDAAPQAAPSTVPAAEKAIPKEEPAPGGAPEKKD